jgi:FAD/FMN-containing dehydrogenase
MASVLDELRQTLGDEVVSVDGTVLDRHDRDATGIAPHRPLAVLRPRNTAEVSTALRICNQHRQPVLPQGGLTGLAGGATPKGGEVVLSLERMRGVEELDPAAATMTAICRPTRAA